MGGANCEGEMGVETLRRFPGSTASSPAKRTRLPRSLRAAAGAWPRRRSGVAALRRNLPAHASTRELRLCGRQQAAAPARRPRSRCAAYSGLRSLLRDAASIDPVDRLIRPGPARREFARLLVGREVPLHVLRPERRRDDAIAPSPRSACWTNCPSSRAATAPRSIQFVDNILDMSLSETVLPSSRRRTRYRFSTRRRRI